MLSIRFYVKLLSVLALIACNNSRLKVGKQESQNLMWINMEYLKGKSFFKPSFVNHFPQSINQLPALFKIDTNSTTDHIRFMLSINSKSVNLDSILSEFSINSIATYQPLDTCLLIVNRFTNSDNWHLRSKHNYVKKELISRECYINKYPIPNFWDSQYFSKTTSMGLPPDFQIFVLEAESGRFWADRYLTSGKYMPKDWKNGYSKGLAYSKKREALIWWFIIW